MYIHAFIVSFICFFDGLGYKDKQDKLADVVSAKKNVPKPNASERFLKCHNVL